MPARGVQHAGFMAETTTAAAGQLTSTTPTARSRPPDVVHSAFPHSVHACARCGSFEALCSLLEARDRSPRACLVLPVSQPLHRARASLFPPHLPIASSLSSPPASHLRLPVSADRPVLKPWSDSEPRSTSRVPRYAYRSDGTQKTTTSKNDPQPPPLPPPSILDLPPTLTRSALTAAF